MDKDGQLKYIIMTWIADPTQATEYAEGQTNGMRVVMENGYS